MTTTTTDEPAPAGDRVVVVVNCGSSTVRVAWFGADRELRRLGRARVSGVGSSRSALRVEHGSGDVFREELLECPDHGSAIDVLLTHLEHWEAIGPVAVVGHRFVHGGEALHEPCLLDAGALARLSAVVPLAPLHLPASLAAVSEFRARWPRVPQVACFDTTFHRTLPEVARMTGLSRELASLGVRRYGFHGLSCESVQASLASVDGAHAAAGRIIVAHLGAGASMTAMRGGRSVDTTMGFSTAGGLVMGTRAGDIDPGLLLHLLQRGIVDSESAAALIYRQSGLLGTSGISGDMEELLRRSAEHDARAAIDLFCHSARKHLASLTAVMGGLDRLVFTGGIGEHAAAIREAICANLAYLGIQVDAVRNGRNARIISPPGNAVIVNVIPADEEVVIAGHAHRLACARPGSPARHPGRSCQP